MTRMQKETRITKIQYNRFLRSFPLRCCVCSCLIPDQYKIEYYKYAIIVADEYLLLTNKINIKYA